MIIGGRPIRAAKVFGIAGVLWAASIVATFGYGYTVGYQRGSERAYERVLDDQRADIGALRAAHADAIREAQQTINETADRMAVAFQATNAAALEDVKRAEAAALSRARVAEREVARLLLAQAARPDPAASGCGVGADWVRNLNASAAAVVAARADDPVDGPADPERGPDPMPAVPTADPRAGRGAGG